MHGMTKREYKITDPNEIRRILDTAKVLRLGIAVDNVPHIIPLNYGYSMEEGKLTFFMHSAVSGEKLELLGNNPHVCFELDCDYRPFEGKLPCQYGLVYSSLMGRGTATLVEDVEEKIRAMVHLMKTQTGKDFTFDEKLVSIVAVIRIDVEEYTAKHRPLPEAMR